MNNPQSEDGTPVSLRLITNIAYGLFALGLLSGGFLGIATIAAIVLIYVKRADVAGTVYAVHFDWLLYTFWWGLLWLGLSGLATLVVIGWFGVVVALVWIVYRVIKGWLALQEYKSPTGF